MEYEKADYLVKLWYYGWCEKYGFTQMNDMFKHV